MTTVSDTYDVRRTESLSPEESQRWSVLLASRDFGALAIDWTEALRQSHVPSLEIEYLQLHRGNTPVALVIIHLLRAVDLGGYIGGGARRLFGLIGQWGWHPLCADIAFIEIPLANLSGILLAPGEEEHAGSIARTVLATVRRELRYDILVLKASPQAPGEDAYAKLGLLHTEFIANMTVELRGERNFDEYMMRLEQKRRTQSRAYRRDFVRVGGTIDCVEHLTDQHLDEISRLYNSTVSLHEAQEDLHVPIPIGRPYFEALSRMPVERRRALIARVDGVAVGFAWLVDSGDAMIFSHCGLDHAKAVPSRAYFNLYYSMFDYALAKGYSRLELGAQAYVVKRKLGGVVAATCYHFEVTSPLLGAVARFVAKHFSSQEGATLAKSRVT
jgi:predicted N-acyltransferase